MVDSCQSSTAKRSSPSPSSSCAPPPKRPRAEAPASPTASVPGRTEEDSAAAAAARSTGSAEDAAAKKDQVGDKPAVAAADSSRRRKEQQQQQQQAAPLGKLVSQRSQLLPLTKREERLKEEICAEFRGRLKEEIYAEVLGRLKEVIRGQIASLNERMNEKMNQIFNQLQAIPVILGASPPQCRSSCASNDIKECSAGGEAVRVRAAVREAGEGAVREGDPRELPPRQGHVPTHC